MSSPNCTITANPDISGIGVRTAIYAQAVLTLIQPILASLDGHISEDELVGLHQLYLGILLPGCALLFSAIIQAKTFGLSAYHGVIVLNLSWINNTSALIFFEFALIAQLRLDKERGFRGRVGDMLALLYELVGENPLPKSDATTLGPSIDLARRMRSTLDTGKNKFRSSKDILENVIRGLELLEVRLNSLQVSKDGNEENKHGATEALKKLVEEDKVRLLTSLGTPVKRPEARSRFMKLMATIDKKKTSMARWWDRVAKWIPGGSQVILFLERDWTMTALASGHLTLFATFGIWLWFTTHDFGLNHECEPFTNVSLVVRTIRVSSPAFRIFSLVSYFISSLPILNILILGGMELIAIRWFLHPLITFVQERALGKSKPTSPTDLSSLAHSPYVLYEFIFLTVLVQVYFITSTELTIKHNEPLLRQHDEDQWTFGQTLAVALTILPLIQVVDESWKNLREWLEKEDPGREEPSTSRSGVVGSLIDWVCRLRRNRDVPSPA